MWVALFPHSISPSPFSSLAICHTKPHFRGFLLQLMAQEAGLHVDMPGFQAAMEEAKELSRAGECASRECSAVMQLVQNASDGGGQGAVTPR